MEEMRAKVRGRGNDTACAHGGSGFGQDMVV